MKIYLFIDKKMNSGTFTDLFNYDIIYTMKRILIIYVFLFLGAVSITDTKAASRFNEFLFSLDGKHMLSIDIQNKTLQSEDIEGKVTLLGKLKTADDVFRDLPRLFNINCFLLKQQVIFTVKGTGQLYRLDLQSLKFDRLDVTYYRGYNFGAAQFFRNDTLFSIGGAGFWQKNGICTYFNKYNKEWDLYPIKKPNPVAVNAFLSGYLLNKDLFFSANYDGEELSDQNYAVNFLDFKNKRWQKKGVLSDQLQTFIKGKELSYLWTGKYGILFSSETLIIDPINNQAYKLSKEMSLDDITFGNRIYLPLQSQKIYRRILNTDTNGPKFKLDSFTVDDLIKKSVLVGQVYDEDWIPEYIDNEWIVLIVVFLIFGLIFWIQKWLQNKVIFDELDKSLIKALIQKTNGDFLSAQDINDLLNINDKSYDNQRKIRSQRINHLNAKLYHIFNELDVVKKIADASDKRISNYYINLEEKIKKLQKIIQ